MNGLEWKLLLKIDSDNRLGFNWADGGSLLFFIHEVDLEKAKFSNVRLIWDTN